MSLTLQAWLEASETTYSAFARQVPCHPSHIRMIALGRSRPIYELACRIERLTDGQVLRTNWFPPDDKPESKDIDGLI